MANFFILKATAPNGCAYFHMPHIAGTNFSGACNILLIFEFPNSEENDQSIKKNDGRSVLSYKWSDKKNYCIGELKCSGRRH